MKNKVFPTIAPKIQAVFGKTLQPGLHLQDLRNFPRRNVLKEGGVPLSSSTGDPITWRKSTLPPMTPLKKRFFLTFLAATFASDLCALYLFQSKRIRSAPLIRQAFKIESLGDNVILTKTISMHHPPKKIININQATKRWLQPR